MISTVQPPPGELVKSDPGQKMSFAELMTNPNSAYAPGTAFRRKRISRLLDLMERVHARHGLVTVIDVGGRRNYWNCVSQEFLLRHRTTITIVNLPGDLEIPAREEATFRYLEADGCDLSALPDNSFHIAHSNSVIEHVGNWENTIRFAREIRRLARSYYVQTPNFWFPIEPHVMKPFFHYLPKPVQAGLVHRMNMGHLIKATSVGDALRKVESINLLNQPMLRELFPDAALLKEKCLGLTKSFIAYREGY